MNPAVLRDYKFALTHTPTPQAVKLKFRAIRGRLRTVYVQTTKTTALNGTLETQERFLIYEFRF
jgi:hypothetical protein